MRILQIFAFVSQLLPAFFTSQTLALSNKSQVFSLSFPSYRIGRTFVVSFSLYFAQFHHFVPTVSRLTRFHAISFSLNFFFFKHSRCNEPFFLSQKFPHSSHSSPQNAFARRLLSNGLDSFFSLPSTPNNSLVCEWKRKNSTDGCGSEKGYSHPSFPLRFRVLARSFSLSLRLFFLHCLRSLRLFFDRASCAPFLPVSRLVIASPSACVVSMCVRAEDKQQEMPKIDMLTRGEGRAKSFEYF